MKKLLFGLAFFISIFVASTAVTHAYTLSDAIKQIQTMSSEIVRLRGLLGAQAVGTTSDTTPRIAYWYGKVNQHVDANGVWTTDPDGTSGANLDKLTYCKKWYPNTTSVHDYQSEAITSWQNAGNTGGPFTATVTSTQCVSTSATPTSTPSITVLSPNGGETYTAGQKITVTWTTENYAGNIAEIDVIPLDMKYGTSLVIDKNFPNTGSYVVTLPTVADAANNYFSLGKNFKIQLSIFGSTTNSLISDQSDNLFTIQAPATPLDPTPRIGYWYGKVNQHVDAQGNWMTDPDGTSGADLDKLAYCKKWYPNTLSVQDYKSESINTWQNAGNTGGPFTASVMTTKCSDVAAAPSITVLSPNGGEIYQIGNPIEVKWKTIGVPTSNKVFITIMNMDAPSVVASFGFQNDGEENITNSTSPLSGYNGFSLLIPGNYRVKLSTLVEGQDLDTTDSSDGTFRIQAPTSSTCTINSFTASPSAVNPGDTATLLWSTTGCDTAYVYGSIVSTTGTKTTQPITDTTTFTLYAGTLPAGCTTFMGYSTTTGASCSAGAVTSSATVNTTMNPIDQILPDGCTSTSGFSPTTGQPCGTAGNTGGLPAGCTSTAGFSPLTGQSCSSGQSTGSAIVARPSPDAFTRGLNIGIAGDDVKALQVRLTQEGVYSGPVTGYFGSMTKDGVMKFQQKHGISPVGIVGPQTLRILNAD